MDLVLPVVPFSVSSPFGQRKLPGASGVDWHPGLDLRAPLGTPVCAVAWGVVIESRLSANDPPDFTWGQPRPADWPAGARWPRIMGFGNLVRIFHPTDASISVYAHMAKRLVEKGDHVTAGQMIGEVGSTGFSSGPHLHFELCHGGQPVDPLPLLPVPKKGQP